MDKVQKPNNSECYTPSSEPFRIYYQLLRNGSLLYSQLLVMQMEWMMIEWLTGKSGKGNRDEPT
jgi:hypothetical protein